MKRWGLDSSSSLLFLRAQGTRGGAVIAVDEDYYTILNLEHRLHSVTVCLASSQCESVWWLTAVYGPQGDQDKIDFLRELRDVKTIVGDKWPVIGDFNLILQAEDKSNDNLNRRHGRIQEHCQLFGAQGIRAQREEVHLVQ